MNVIGLATMLGAVAFAPDAQAKPSTNSLVFTLLDYIDRGDITAAAQAIVGSVSITTDGQEETIEPKTLIRMISACRFDAVESYGGSELIARWACSEYDSHAKTVSVEMGRDDSKLEVVDVQVLSVPATVKPIPVMLYTPAANHSETH